MKKKVSPKIILKNGGLFMGLIILTLYIILKNNNMEDIIKSIDDGLYAKKMGGGSVNPVTGEFNFAVAEGYLVKNGEIKTWNFHLIQT